MAAFLKSILLLICLSQLVSLCMGKFVCPYRTEIMPCVCEPEGALPDTQGLIYCNTLSTTQQNITNLVQAVRVANNVSASDWLTLDKISIKDTDLVQLDLTFLAKLNVRELEIHYNLDMTTLTGATEGNESDIAEFKFRARQIMITYNILRDESVAKLFSLVANPAEVTVVSLYFNHLSANLVDQDHPGMFPYMASFENLQELDLTYNWLLDLKGGQLQNYTRLTKFSNLNTLAGFPVPFRLHDGGFLFNEFDEDMKNVTLTINLQNCMLRDDGVIISDKTGLGNFQRPLFLDWSWNHFDFLSQKIFEPILQANEQNAMKFARNSFVCDGRMKWLHDQRDLYEFRVTDVDCSNDPGKNIFTTELELN